MFKCRQCQTGVTTNAKYFWAQGGYCDDCYADKLPVSAEIDERRAKVNAANITLNGERAIISGYENRFARVTQIDSGLGAEWSWEAIDRVVAKGGVFKS